MKPSDFTRPLPEHDLDHADDPETPPCGPKIVSGAIKWFDPEKGFGFILSDEGGPDILLHANVLRNFGQNSIADNTRIQVSMVPTLRGFQAVEVLSIEPPAETGAPLSVDLGDITAEDLAKLPLLPARVKWFDKGKSFGFANIFGEKGDVFLHIEVLRHSGFADLSVGEAIALRVVNGRRGMMAAQIIAWDRATT